MDLKCGTPNPIQASTQSQATPTPVKAVVQNAASVSMDTAGPVGAEIAPAADLAAEFTPNCISEEFSNGPLPGVRYDHELDLAQVDNLLVEGFLATHPEFDRDTCIEVLHYGDGEEHRVLITALNYVSSSVNVEPLVQVSANADVKVAKVEGRDGSAPASDATVLHQKQVSAAFAALDRPLEDRLKPYYRQEEVDRGREKIRTILREIGPTREVEGALDRYYSRRWDSMSPYEVDAFRLAQSVLPDVQTIDVKNGIQKILADLASAGHTGSSVSKRLSEMRGNDIEARLARIDSDIGNDVRAADYCDDSRVRSSEMQACREERQVLKMATDSFKSIQACLSVTR